MFKTKWPQPHDDALRTMAAQGKTNGEIARLLNEKFGTAYSRNAVIGRASRMSLCSQSGKRGNEDAASNLQTKQAREKQRLHYAKRKRSPSADDKIRIAARSNLPASYVRAAQPRMVCDAPPLADDRGEIGLRGIALVEVTGCRWPSGDGSAAVPFTFCNASFAFKGCAYCAEHRRMALRNAA